MSAKGKAQDAAGEPGGERGEAQHRLVVDRFEGDFAVVEADGGTMLDLPRWMLPPGAREGDVIAAYLSLGEGGERRLELAIDEAATASARGEVEDILSRLRGRDPGGDLAL